MAGAGAGEADGVACPAVMGSTTHQELTLELTADVAEWCPLPSHRRLLAAGTYQLDEATQQRHGRLHLYQLRGDLEAAVPAVAPLHLHPCGTLDLPGIFDLRWRPGGDAPALAAALADGSVRLLEMEVGGGTQEGYVAAEVSEVARSPARDGSMALSLDFSPAGGGGGGSVISSFSCGTLRHFQVTPAALAPLAEWQAHSLEAWTAAFDHFNPQVLYSGGDDSAFKGWDLREPGRAAWADAKAHGAGVCCVASSPHREHLLCTGSYDEVARVWDARSPARPLLRAQVGAGGGVWRLRWHPADPALLLGACMHAGFAVLRVADGCGGAIEVAERYPHQRSLAYGAGWCSEAGGGGTSVAATCSFYDRLLHVWSPATRASSRCAADGPVPHAAAT